MAVRRPLTATATISPVGRLPVRASCCWIGPSRQRLRRNVQISAAPLLTSDSDAFHSASAPASSEARSADARFEVLGAPYSLLSVSLSASQNLFTRRGTLVGVSGKAENAVSTLSILPPLCRAALGIPFLYQKISSTSPLTALLSTRSPITSFVVVQLDGTIDWMVAQRQALLAWTGHSLSVRPIINRKMNLAHWGNSKLVGRGLVALVGKGQVYQVTLEPGEEFVIHPSNLLGYTITQKLPLPFRLKSSALRLQAPTLSFRELFPGSKFIRAMKDSGTWKTIVKFYFTVRTWSRRTIRGDRLFLRFQGPATILMQSRSSQFRDVLTSQDINELADTEPGAVQSAIKSNNGRRGGMGQISPRDAALKSVADVPTGLKIVSVGRGGNVEFQDTDDLKPFTRLN